MSDTPPGVASDPAAALERMEQLAAALLRVGVLASIAFIAIGLAITLVRHPEYLADPTALSRLTAPGAAFPHSLPDVAVELADGRGRAVVAAGLLLLIATPVLRVATTAVALLRERDWTFAGITGAVLAILALSFGLGWTV